MLRSASRSMRPPSSLALRRAPQDEAELAKRGNSTDSLVKQPRLRRPCSLRRRVRRRSSSCPPTHAEGMERRPAPHRCSRFSARRVRRDARAARRSIAAFLSPGPCFRAWTVGRHPPLSGPLSPPFIRAASSHQRQSLVVGTDGEPEASRARGYEPRPRAPHQPAWHLHHSGPLKLLRLRDVSRRRPQLSKATGSWARITAEV
jgi:hypothetical protein